MTIRNDIKELEDRIEYIENTYKPIGLVTLYLKEPKQSLRRLMKQIKNKPYTIETKG